MTTRVVKFGGRAQGDSALPTLLAAAAQAPGARVVVVHGGGDDVSAMQRRLGLEPQFVGGRRVTSEADLEVVRMLLSGTVNKRLVAQLVTAGVRAVGLSGEDAGLLSARVTDPTFGRVGRDVLADVRVLADLLAAGWLPVISPLARDRDSADGAGLNVNGDDAATAVAVALQAQELCFIADVEGVLNGGQRIPQLDPAAIQALAARGVVQGGMLAKLEAAVAALEAGVGAIRIGTLACLGDPQAGTTIVSSVPATQGNP
ncbi:MAG: acetylglutamate kinase [Gemmatimonadaceae bacterium]|nr:acetylglutamate kinase [Gemmatimonadaceae bacterium]MCW5827030.1 acetylglutamate kinase [Gemmatimonadaceae bacterium]